MASSAKSPARSFYLNSSFPPYEDDPEKRARWEKFAMFAPRKYDHVSATFCSFAHRRWLFIVDNGTALIALTTVLIKHPRPWIAGALLGCDAWPWHAYQMRPSYSTTSNLSTSSGGVRARRRIIIPFCSGVGSSSVALLPANGPRHTSQPKRA